MTNPKAPAVKRNSICCSWVKDNRSRTAMRTPGTTPALPAVGVAQINPIFAFTSLTAIALRTADKMVSPLKKSASFK